MEREFAKQWLNNLKEAWWDKDIEKATSLFTKTTFYQETPFMKPYTTFDEIKQEWQHIKNQDIKNIEFRILAIDNNVVIVEWIFERDITTYDGIYEIKFNDNLECIYFKSWEMEKIKRSNIKNKSNIFVLHSLNGDTISIWGQDIKENFNKQSVEVFLPEFPIRADSSYEKFRDILKVYLDNKELNENSIVICHSIGNAYFIRFCKDMNYIPKAYIAVAPGAVYNIPSNRNDYIVKVKAQAYCKQEQLDFVKEKLETKYCLYSDEDEPKKEMFKKFIDDTNSIGIYLKYYNHFDGYHRIYKIPELTELINKILKG